MVGNKMTIKSILKRNQYIVKGVRDTRYFYYKNLISSERLLRRQFKKRLGRELNLQNPVYFNDKLQWLKLHWYDPTAIKCADKYAVRGFIADTIGSEYLNDLLAVYESVDEIDLEELPKSFVLKGTHGSGFNIICKDKNQMDWKNEFKKMRRWLRTNYYWSNREWVYKDIKPRIICERFIEQGEGRELRDYRFFCFNGIPKFVSVDLSINNKEKTRRNLYDLDWNLMDGEISYPKELSLDIKKPSNLNTMIDLSKKVSARFPHARVDFYNIAEEIIFGEITFFHQSGWGKITPSEFEKEIGDYLRLPD